jgi:hypothetical protein
MADPHDPIDILPIWMEIIITEFIQDKQEDHQATGNAHRQPEQVDQREHFLFPEILECNQQVISEHEMIFPLPPINMPKPDASDLQCGSYMLLPGKSVFDTSVSVSDTPLRRS